MSSAGTAPISSAAIAVVKVSIREHFAAAFVVVLSFGTLSLARADQLTFSHTGAEQTWVVPNGVTSVMVDARGAQGGGFAGGLGGRVEGTLPVAAGNTLHIFVGGSGMSNVGTLAVC